MLESKKFYDEIAKYYNDIFPVDSVAMNFLKKHFIKGNILDVACGRGENAIILLKEGYEIYGNDLSEKMILSIPDDYKEKFIVADMTNLRYFFKFANIYCIGTSIAHLKDKKEVLKAITGFCNLQDSGGVLILQTVNFDRILKYGITSLPTIKNNILEFNRNYVLHNKKIDFVTKLTVKNVMFENSIVLIPITAKMLTDILDEAGYTNIALYNGFSDDAFNEDTSFALTVKCTKK